MGVYTRRAQQAQCRKLSVSSGVSERDSPMQLLRIARIIVPQALPRAE